MSTQLDDFKRVLGLNDDFQDAATPAQEAARGSTESVTMKKEGAGLARRTVSIPGSLHTRISLLGLWMNRDGLMDNPRMYEVIAAAIDEYISQHPTAAGYVNKA